VDDRLELSLTGETLSRKAETDIAVQPVRTHARLKIVLDDQAEQHTRLGKYKQATNKASRKAA